MMTMTTLLKCLNLHPRRVNLKRLQKNFREITCKKTVTNKAVMKDQGCQTSPAFVKAADKAKKQRKALSAKASSATANNPEMEEFAEMAINSAKKVSARGKKKSTAAASEAADASEVENNFGMENPTPAMLALMA